MDHHREAMQALCRLCGKRTLKWRDHDTNRYQVSKYATRVRRFGIHVEEDHPDIHPIHICLACIASTSQNKQQLTRSVITWTNHQEGNCTACNLFRKTAFGKHRPTTPAKQAAARREKRKKETDVKMRLESAFATILDLSAHLNPTIQLKKVATAIFKILFTDSNNSYIELPTGGQKLVIQKLSKPRIPSDSASRRTLGRRALAIEGAMERISSPVPSESAVNKQLAALLKLKSPPDLHNFLQEQDLLKIRIPTGVELMLKVRLGWSWAEMRLMKGWLRQYGIIMAAESVTRCQRAQILGNSLQWEMLPFFYKDTDDIIRTKLAPIVYIPDLVGHIMSTIDELDRNALLDRGDRILLKIGGDKGGGTTKFYYQIANSTCNPNSRQNSIVFCAFEGDDSVANLHLAIDRYSDQVEDLLKANWQGIPVDVWLCGDFAMDFKLLGLQGASATFPCMECHINKNEINDTTTNFKSRSLQTIQDDFKKVNAAGNTRAAKRNNHSVSHSPFFNIPLDKVCPPVLHINLGLYNKFYNDLVEDVQRLGDVIVDELTEEVEDVPSTSAAFFDKFVSKKAEINKIIRQKESEAQQLRAEVVDMEFDMMTQALTQTTDPTTDDLSIMSLLHEQAQQLDQQAADLREEYHIPEGTNPLVKALDESLKKFKVQRQAYHSKTFIGNHIDKCLKEKNYNELLQSVVDTTKQLCPHSNDLHDAATAIHMKYMLLFEQFNKCYKVYSSSKKLTPAEIDTLEEDIKNLVDMYLQKWRKLTPKFHYLAKHLIKHIRKLGMGLGILSEQGGEQLHNLFNILGRRMDGAKNVQGMSPNLYHLLKTMEEHLVYVHPSMRFSKKTEE